MPAKRVNWDLLVPKQELRWLVGGFPPDTEESKVVAAVQREGVRLGWTKAGLTAAVKFALSEHRRNQRLYLSVVSGGRVPRRIRRQRKEQ